MKLVVKFVLTALCVFVFASPSFAENADSLNECLGSKPSPNSEQNPGRTIEVCTNALRSSPNWLGGILDIVIYKVRGDAYFKQGEYERAIADFTKVIERSPQNFTGYYLRAVAYEQLAKATDFVAHYVRAAADYRKALDINPTDQESVEGLRRLPKIELVPAKEFEQREREQR